MTSQNRPTSDERDKLAKADWRSPNSIVVTRPYGSANYGYAYHERGEDGSPLCGAGDTDDEFESVTVADAQRRNKSPCQMCNRILRQRDKI